MKFLLAKKLNMSQVFNERGVVIPVTVLNVSPIFVSQIKTKDKDGYSAVQIGFGERKGKNVSKAIKGQIKSIKGFEDGKKSFEKIKEFRVNEDLLYKFNVGDNIGLDGFTVGDKVTISAISKGKGFQGVVKRHGFHGGPRSHGQKHSEREPGSIGGGGRDGGRVVKGKRMAGRMGGDRITVKNLRIVEIDNNSSTLVISGAIPGRRGTIVEIMKS